MTGSLRDPSHAERAFDRYHAPLLLGQPCPGVRRVRERVEPLLEQMQGFRGYYLLDGGQDVLITVSMFDSADEALLSNEQAAAWVRNNVLEFTKGMLEIMVGNALIRMVKEQSGEVSAPATVVTILTAQPLAGSACPVFPRR